MHRHRLISTAAAQPVVAAIYPGLCGISAVFWVMLSTLSMLATQLRPWGGGGADDGDGDSGGVNTETLHGFTVAAAVGTSLAWVLQAGFNFKAFPEAHMGFAGLTITGGVVWMWLAAGLAVATAQSESVVAWRFCCAGFATALSCGFGASFGVGLEQAVAAVQPVDQRAARVVDATPSTTAEGETMPDMRGTAETAARDNAPTVRIGAAGEAATTSVSTIGISFGVILSITCADKNVPLWLVGGACRDYSSLRKCLQSPYCADASLPAHNLIHD